MTKISSNLRRYSLLVLVVMVFCVIVLSVFEFFGKRSLPVSSVQISSEEFNELKQKADAGDAASQYALTLYVDDAGQSERLLKSAADAGYLPALVTFSQALMAKGGADAVRAKKMLVGAAERGYYPAIAELVHCLDAGECGLPSKIEAYIWVAVADLLVRQGKVERSPLNDEEKRLRLQLTQGELEHAQTTAQAIAERMASGVVAR